MLTLMPSAVSASTARMPSTVAGTLIMTLGRDTSRQRWRASQSLLPCRERSLARLEADEPVRAVAVVVHGSKNIGRQLDVLNDQPFGESPVTHVESASSARWTEA